MSVFWTTRRSFDLSKPVAPFLFGLSNVYHVSVVDTVWCAIHVGELDVIKWLCSTVEGVINTPIAEILKKAEACSIAAYSGHVLVLQWLIDNDIAIDYEKGNGLPEAASEGHFSVVKWLVEHGANPDEVEDYGHTALHCSAANGTSEMVQYLVGNGADVMLRGEHEKTALHFCGGSIGRKISICGIQATAVDTSNRTALHYASVAQNFAIQALLEAAKGNRADLLLSLTDRGVDTQYTTFQGRTALHEAAGNGAIEAINVLLEQGLNINEADKFGVTPLLEASLYGQVGALRRLLEAQGGLDEADLAGQTALHLAATGRHEKAVDLLVKSGADISSCDKRGWTSLHYAASGGHIGVVEALIAPDAVRDKRRGNRYDARCAWRAF
ncbi:Serine/threonine-protein phosphatase 6 regulatory ankyrin repeat subunit B [Phytophthora citrophthora]|uniref:Serine/threonine-protein phosphatase 6 regulatory ankyrin repeat subunit B n=1 Tax=Phytophthora citrophthora TaxID=4793 RepID=A0AAD9LNX9_9STRA|nr:Serine/threonine-protein phosphatase 6 regulatory ankyrin repeat subunit B [Phytophthora citrophthora]